MDLLASGPERAPRRPTRLPRSAVAVLAAALAVLVSGVVALPGLRERAQARDAPPQVTATTSGGSAIGGRLRVWLLLEGPPSAALGAVVPQVEGSDVRAGLVPAAFSSRGFAVVRLDVAPRCPEGVLGLDDARLRLDVGRPARTVQVPFSTDGLLASTVRARCSGEEEVLPARGPRVRAGGGAVPGALRTVVELGAPGPEVLVVTAVEPGPGLALDVVTPLPLRVAPGRRARLVVDLRATGCAADPEAPPFALQYAADGEVDPVVDASLRGRLDALRRAAC